MFAQISFVLLVGIALCSANGGFFPRDCFRPNEAYYCGSACQTTCLNYNETCPIINIMCNDMCYCIPGYARDQTGSCIPYKKCEERLNGICGENEELRVDTHLNNECHAIAWDQYLRQEHVEGCYCIKGYKKDSTGKCIPQEQCTPIPDSTTTTRAPPV
ncbi:PREDICTED: inducible metalloproteinase inhibitor protein-like [Nicrophorus vespilloides]|uniref:Inducible metalloproteinase inhibitor protein-like n=1 Tax=Nicrophorus vespilloides TaxID=110193 RepID=A0ABM1MH37_NICVS|nr:PREDICTED: inducible metalloproteinase inhibitor protein-like [Nicrophorus vespilloides]